MNKNIMLATVTSVATLVVMLGFGEAVLRLKNSSMKNYDIEMWRYSNELKIADPGLGHDHVKNTSAMLQSVTIRTNELGLRGGPIEPSGDEKRKILFLGASITLGWGVPEKETVTARLEDMFERNGEDVAILNAGIGNYNAERYVKRFMRDMQGLNPTDIVIHYFLRDAEQLDHGGGNWFLRNSQLAVTLWIAASRLFNKSGGKSLEDHYRAVYEPDQPGYQAMVSSLKQLKDHADKNDIRVYLAMTPDVHNLKDYKFGFVHKQIATLAGELGFEYVDLFPAFGGLSQQQVWAMPGDPHPNSLGHQLMAETLYPVLSETE